MVVMLCCIDRAEGGIPEFLVRPCRDGLLITGHNQDEI